VSRTGVGHIYKPCEFIRSTLRVLNHRVNRFYITDWELCFRIIIRTYFYNFYTHKVFSRYQKWDLWMPRKVFLIYLETQRLRIYMKDRSICRQVKAKIGSCWSAGLTTKLTQSLLKIDLKLRRLHRTNTIKLDILALQEVRIRELEKQIKVKDNY